MTAFTSKNKLRFQPRQFFRPAYLIGTCSLVLILIFSYFFVTTSRPEKALASPLEMTFTNPSLISGTAGSVGAVYLFSNVSAGIDARIEILASAANTSISSMDYSSAGYANAWQPFLITSNSGDGYYEWKVSFKKAGTSTDTVLSEVSLTAIDVDGIDNLYEYVEAANAISYGVYSPTNLSITYPPSYCRASGPNYSINDIDTSQKQVMFQINYQNISSFTYRTGINNNTGSNHTRQFCLFFRSFFPTPTPLPVSLLQFSGMKKEDQVVLEWFTASESNNDYFSIERSESNQWIKLGKISGNGTTNSVHRYSFIDTAPLPVNYYRLRQFDYNGNHSELGTVMIEMDKNSGDYFNIRSENPFSDQVEFELYNPEEVPFEIVVYSSKGKKLKSVRKNSSNKSETITIGDLNHLEPGVYFFHYNSSGATKKVIKAVKS